MYHVICLLQASSCRAGDGACWSVCLACTQGTGLCLWQYKRTSREPHVRKRTIQVSVTQGRMEVKVVWQGDIFLQND